MAHLWLSSTLSFRLRVRSYRDENIQGGPQDLKQHCGRAVLVPAEPSQRLIAAFGDSLSTATGSTVDADGNWRVHLSSPPAKRASADSKLLAVVNEGIGGNRLLTIGDWHSMGDNALAAL